MDIQFSSALNPNPGDDRGAAYLGDGLAQIASFAGACAGFGASPTAWYERGDGLVHGTVLSR